MEKNSNNSDETILEGVPVSLGIVQGKVYIYKPYKPEVRQYFISNEDIESEINKFKNAVLRSAEQITSLKANLDEKLGEEYARIFESHLMILKDPFFVDEIIERIKEEKLNSEYILHDTLNIITESFKEIENETIKERALDIYDIGRRVLQNLGNTSEMSLGDITEECIVVAKELTPSDIMNFSKELLSGFITEHGGKTSHTAIISVALQIPAVIGVENATQKLKNNDYVILDAVQGNILINPDESTIKKYNRILKTLETRKRKNIRLARTANIVKKGKKINIYANVELPEEVDLVMEYGGEGVGLYRTEFLFIDKVRLPSENEQFLTYKKLANRLKKNPLIIRTLDAGSDKINISNLENVYEERNPFLGLRGIRFCLNHKDIFLSQLRAILRASYFGNILLLIPMVSFIEEVYEVKNILKLVKDELKSEELNFDHDIKLGIMVEIPSVALNSDTLAKEVDFFSIGTNDLIQYTLAADRINERVEKWFQPLHPAVLQLIKLTIEGGQKSGIPVGVCGDMAEHPISALLLVGLGVDSLSMSPMYIPDIKKLLKNISIRTIKRFTEEILKLSSLTDIREYIEKEVDPVIYKVIPKYIKAKEYLL